MRPTEASVQLLGVKDRRPDSTSSISELVLAAPPLSKLAPCSLGQSPGFAVGAGALSDERLKMSRTTALKFSKSPNASAMTSSMRFLSSGRKQSQCETVKWAKDARMDARSSSTWPWRQTGKKVMSSSLPPWVCPTV